MIERLKVLDGEYELLPVHSSMGVFVAKVHHVRHSGPQTFATPVADLFAFLSPSVDRVHSHWCVRIFASSGVRYEEESKVTTLVYSPQQQAGSNTARYKHLIALRDGNFPSVHPNLPRAVGTALLNAAVCSEPMAVYLHAEIQQVLLEFGVVFHDDDDA